MKATLRHGNYLVGATKVEDLELKVWLLMDETGWVGELQKYLDAPVGELGSGKQTLRAKEVSLKEKVHEYGLLDLESGTVWAALARGERVIHDLAERVSTGHVSLVHEQASS